MRAADKAVVYYNPATGEHRTPARTDQPLPEVYARQGFERREIDSMVAWEKEAGVVHESTTFNSGNEEITHEEPVYRPNPEAVKAVVKDIADAISSGPWTGGLP